MAIDIKNLLTNVPGSKDSPNVGRGKNEAVNNRAAPTTSPTTAAPGSDDKVDISGHSRTLQSAHARLRDTPDVNEAKVQSIKQALNDGSYNVDADKVAGKMIAFEDALNFER